jgi:hypothetical protein
LYIIIFTITVSVEETTIKIDFIFSIFSITMTSYPASPSGRRPDQDLMTSSSPLGPASLNTLVVSLQAMKERCVKNQRCIDQVNL